MKIKREDYNNIWFTSDWHYQHDRDFIVEDRGFGSIADHNAFLIETFNKMVDPDDIVFHLGDLSYGNTYTCTKLLESLECKNVHFIMGNHDKTLRDTLRGLKGGVNKSLGQYHELRMNYLDSYQDITLCHYPMLSWNKSHHGAWQLCGHSHGSNPQSLPYDTCGKRLDVGVDVGLKFNRTFMFTFEDVLDIMERKKCTEHH